MTQSSALALQWWRAAWYATPTWPPGTWCTRCAGWILAGWSGWLSFVPAHNSSLWSFPAAHLGRSAPTTTTTTTTTTPHCPPYSQVDYTLSTLARNLLKQDRAELSPTDIPGGCPRCWQGTALWAEARG